MPAGFRRTADGYELPLEAPLPAARCERIAAELAAIFAREDAGAHRSPRIGDASKVQTLFEGLAARGWSDDDLRALGHRNWLRVLRATWH